MSDAVVPSYRVARESSGVPWRMLAIAGGLVGVVAVGAGGWWAFRSLGGGGGVPVVEADPRPFKVRPDDPGGLRVPNQSELILERPGQRSQSPAQAGRPATVAPGAEAPDIGGLRAAVATPPAPAVPQAAPLAAAPQAAAPAGSAARPAGQPAAMPAPVPAQSAAPAAAAPAAAAPAAAAPAAAQGPRFGGRTQVQLGALPTEEGARAEWDRLTRRAPELFQGRSPQISRLDREGQAPLFRLRLGGLADQDAATQFCELVRARGGACVPVRS
jgi:hypothetical protein